MPHRFLILAAIIGAAYGFPVHAEPSGSYIADVRAYRLPRVLYPTVGFNGQIRKIALGTQHAVFFLQAADEIQIGDLTIGTRDGEITWNGQAMPPESSSVIANTMVEGRFGEEVVIRTLDTRVPQYFEQVDPKDPSVFRLHTIDDSLGFVASLRLEAPTRTEQTSGAGAYDSKVVVRAVIPEGREHIEGVALDVGKPILFTDESDARLMGLLDPPNGWLALCTVTPDNGSLVTLLRVRYMPVADAAQDVAPSGFLFESRVYEITGNLQEDPPQSVLAHSIDGPPVKMLLEHVLHDFPAIDGDWDGEQTATALQTFLGGVLHGGKAELQSAPRLTLRPNPSTRYKVAMVDRGRDPSRPREDVLDSVPSIGDWLAHMGVNDWVAKRDTGIPFGLIADLRNVELSYRTTNSPNTLDSYREYAGILHGTLVQTSQDGALNIQIAFECRRIRKNPRRPFPSLEAAKAIASSTAFTATFQTKPGDVTPFLYSETENRHILILVRVTKLVEST